MNFNKEKYLYQRAKNECDYISGITSSLEQMYLLQKSGVLDVEKIDSDYEKRQLRDIKNSLANIFLMLDLQEVECACESVFNKDFKGDVKS